MRYDFLYFVQFTFQQYFSVIYNFLSNFGLHKNSNYQRRLGYQKTEKIKSVKIALCSF